MVEIQDDLKYCFFEISEILKYMPSEYNKKLPENFVSLINENKISNGFSYDKEKTLENQKMLKDTKVLLSILYRNYWCSEEKRRELEEYDNNILKQRYNPDNIFKNRNQKENITKNEVAIVEYKESILKKIINKIKDIFKRKSH